MYPVLFKISSFPVTSFGFFLLMSILVSLFVLWRLANVYDFDKEKILDVFIFTLIFGLIGARVAFIWEHSDTFHPFFRVFMLNRFPGLSFWGAFWTGSLALLILSKAFKLFFWQVADMAVVAIFFGLTIGNIGCFLGGCQYGYPSNIFFAVPQAGLIDKRFPIQFFQTLTFAFFGWILWKNSLQFHFLGRITGQALIILAVVNLLFSFFRADQHFIFPQISLNQILSVLLLIFGLIVYYRLSHRSAIKDLSYSLQLPFRAKLRQQAILNLKKFWYKLTVDFQLALQNWRKGFKRYLNVKPTPKKF